MNLLIHENFLLLAVLTMALPLAAQSNNTDDSTFRFGDDKEDTKIIDPELRALERRNGASLQAGKTNATDIANYVQSYEMLLAKHAGEKTEAAAQILYCEFNCFYGVLDDSFTGLKMLNRLARDYPDTILGRKIGKVLKEPGDQDGPTPVSLAGNPWTAPIHGSFTLSLVRSFVLSNDCVLAPLENSAHTNLLVQVPDFAAANPNHCAFPSDLMYQAGLPLFNNAGTQLLTLVNPTTIKLLDAFTRKPVGAPLKHGAKVIMGAFSPDNLMLATAADDGRVRLWNTQDGRLMGDPIAPKQALAAFFFSGDSSRLCVAATNSVVTVWDVRTGRAVGKPFKCCDEGWAEAHMGSGGRTEFSPNGHILLDGGGPYWLWDVETGTRSKYSIDQDDKIFDIAFSPDSKRVVTVAGAGARAARVWDTQTGKPLTKPLHHHFSVFTAQFLPDGRRFVTTCLDNAVRIWDSVTGELVVLCYHPEADKPIAVLSPDGLYLITLGGKTARIWSTATGELVAKPMEFPDDVKEARFSLDSKALVTVTSEQRVQIWKMVK